MMRRETFAIANIYVPVKRRATLDPKKAQAIAESMLQVGQQTPILVRQDGVFADLADEFHVWMGLDHRATSPCYSLHALVPPGLHDVSDDRVLTELLACFQAMQPLHQHEAFARCRGSAQYRPADGLFARCL
jgi:hypothetical protein